MKEKFKDYLFNHHVLVSENDPLVMHPESLDRYDVLITLATKFGIRIKKGVRLATLEMVRDAGRNLGINVPEPFYKGFPHTVRDMTRWQLLYDQLYHYTQTYGLGWFEDPGHSVLENDNFDAAAAFDTIVEERCEPKDFIILSEDDATKELFDILSGLCKSTRPLNIDQQRIILEAYNEYGQKVIGDGFASKTTAAMFICDTRNMAFAKGLKLQDTIKVLEYIQYHEYENENLKKLNLKNKDRKLIIKLLDYFFDKPITVHDCQECFEKQKIWQGLLHHLHYKPKNKTGESFVKSIREDKNCSVMSEFEYEMSHGHVVEAAKCIIKYKGQGALTRNLNYILSRCKDSKEITEVLSCLE